MKFIYIGELPIKDMDLAIAGIFKPSETIRKGTVFEVPDDNPILIQRVSVGGCYEPFVEPKKKVGRPRKQEKEEEIEEEE